MKVQTLMLLQAIGLLDDLDKELNTYAMRVREWYGWHFPEMTKIVADNIHYAKAVSPLSLDVCQDSSTVDLYSRKALDLEFSNLPSVTGSS